MLPWSAQLVARLPALREERDRKEQTAIDGMTRMITHRPEHVPENETQ